MKTLKKVVAVMVLMTLGYTACKKEVDQLMVSTPQTMQKDATERILPVYKMHPTTITGPDGKIVSQFTYNNKMQLTSMFKVGEDFMTFAYTTNGKLQRINHYSGQAETQNNLKSFDLLVYPNISANAPAKIERYAIKYSDPTTTINSSKATSTTNIGQRPTSTVAITYDISGRKISELEYLSNIKSRSVEQRYTYDNTGNVKNVQYYVDGILKSTIHYNQYDTHYNMLLNVNEFGLIPFNYTSANNVIHYLKGYEIVNPQEKLNQNNADIFDSGNELLVKYTYNSSGFPITMTRIIPGGDYTEKIEYTMPDIQ